MGLETVVAMARDGMRSAEFRSIAIDALTCARDSLEPEARAALAQMIRAGLPAVLESRAARAYGELAGEEAVPALLDLLENGALPPGVVLEAVREFATRKDLPLLSERLESAVGRDSQELLLRAIAHAAGDDGVTTLLRYLGNPPESVRPEAIGRALQYAVRKADLPRVWEALEAARDPHVQSDLALAILSAGDPGDLERLCKLAEEPRSGLSRSTLARALHHDGSARSLPLMKALLADTRGWEESRLLAQGIARVGSEDGMKYLLEMAAMGASEERRRAILQAIEECGDERALAHLSTMFTRERDAGTCFHIAKALLRLDPELTGEDLARDLTRYPSPAQRAAVAQVLETRAEPNCIGYLSRALAEETDNRARWRMARALAGCGEQGFAALRKTIDKESDPQRRFETLRGAGSLDPGGVYPLARRMLREDASPLVRGEAAGILGRSGRPGAEVELRQALSRESDDTVRESIGSALGALGR
jgi:HEAT repeat protein